MDSTKPHKQYKREDMLESQAELRLHFRETHTTAWTILRHVSSSGMSRRISVIASTPDGPLDVTFNVARALGMPIYRMSRGDRVYVQDEGIRMDGAGMDMGFHLVYSLSHALFGDGYAIKHRWL